MTNSYCARKIGYQRDCNLKYIRGSARCQLL